MGREEILERELDMSSTAPLYYKLMILIEQCIVEHVLQPGELLPSEHELCEHFHVSRTTVRQAFSALEEKGLVERLKGKGTFVAMSKLSRSLNTLYSFSGEMTDLGLSAESKVLSFEVMDTPMDLMEDFQSPGVDVSKVYVLRRIRNVNHMPFSYERVYIPVYICPYLTKELVENASLYKILKDYANIIPAKARETYSTTIMNAKYAKMLDAPVGLSAFSIKRITHDLSDRCFEIAFNIVRGDRCRYEVELKSNNVSFIRQVDSN